MSRVGCIPNLDQRLIALPWASVAVTVTGSLPRSLSVTAETGDGLVMGLGHESFPVHGVQFHPESIASENGHALLQNFLDLARDFVPA